MYRVEVFDLVNGSFFHIAYHIILYYGAKCSVFNTQLSKTNTTIHIKYRCTNKIWWIKEPYRKKGIRQIVEKLKLYTLPSSYFNWKTHEQNKKKLSISLLLVAFHIKFVLYYYIFAWYITQYTRMYYGVNHIFLLFSISQWFSLFLYLSFVFSLCAFFHWAKNEAVLFIYLLHKAK